MHNFFMFLGIFLILIGLPLSIILTIVFVIIKISKKKKSIWGIIISSSSIILCPLLGLFLIFIGGFLYGQTDEYKEFQEQLESENTIENVEIESEKEEIVIEQNTEEEQAEIVEEEIISEEVIEEATEVAELTEEEYKELCKEMYYDEVFFGDDLSKGDFVELHLMVSENYYFTMDSLYSDSFSDLMDKWDLHRDFKKCSVLRENEDSYFGVGKVDLYFSNKYELNPIDYQPGDKIIIYGEVISFYKDEWDGYNDVVIVPKYICVE